MYHCCLTSNEQHCIYIHEFMTKTSLQTMQIVLVKRTWTGLWAGVYMTRNILPCNGPSTTIRSKFGVILVVQGISYVQGAW
jgi:hypothetical protein